MRRWFAFVLAIMLLVTGMTVMAEEEKKPVKIMGFLYDKCGNCGVTINKPGCGECTLYLGFFGKMRIELLELTEQGVVKFDMHNTQLGQFRPEYYAYAQAFGVPDELLNVSPQFFVGAPEYGVVLTGDETVYELAEAVEAYLENLPEGGRTEFPQEEVTAAAAKLDLNGDPLEEAEQIPAEPEPTAEPEKDFYRNDDLAGLKESDSRIVYVYKPNCEFCAKIKPLLEGLPEHVILADGTVSRIVFASLNKDDYDQYQAVKQYYEDLLIPEDHRYSPLLIVGEKFYMGYDEIVPNLMNALIAGDGLLTDLTPALELE